MGFPQSPVQLLEKIKKAHNSVKKQNFKKRKKLIMRSHNTSVHAKNQVSWFNGMGSRRRTKIKKSKNGVFFHKTHFFYLKKKLLTFSIKNYLQKIRFVPFMCFPQSPVQLLEKIKKGP